MMVVVVVVVVVVKLDLREARVACGRAVEVEPRKNKRQVRDFHH